MATGKTLLQEVRELNEKKQFQAVIDMLPDDILQKENSADLYAEKAQAYWRLSKNELCEEMADKALAINADHAKANNYKGHIYDDLKEYDRAIACYKRAIAANPKYEYPYNGLGIVYKNKGDYDAAIGWYRKAIELNPRFEYPYNGLGNVYIGKGDYDTAIEWYQKAIELNPKYVSPYNGLGSVYSGQGDYEAAIGWYQKAIELNPKYVYPYNSLGIAYKNKGDYDAAIKWYEKAMELNPQYHHPYYNRALVYEALGDNANALADYERFIELTKDKADYYTDRARERVAELKKAVKSIQYSDIAELVTQIKNLLLFSDGCITHYTGLSTAKALILNGSPFRLSEGAFLNDTSEGRELFTYLNFHAKALKSHEMEALTFTPKPFIGSFVAETKHDDLTLWRMYGKEEKEEAKGCAITLHQQQLVEAIQNKVAPGGSGGVSLKANDAFSFYRVAYKSHDNQFILPGANEAIVEKLNEYMQDLATKIKVISTDKKKKLQSSKIFWSGSTK